MLTLCRTLMGDPDLIMIDEPTEGLAPKIVELVAEYLRELQGRGVSVLLVEQKLTIALEISQRCLVMGHGQIVFEGTPDELQGQRRHPQGVARGLSECAGVCTVAGRGAAVAAVAAATRRRPDSLESNDRSIFAMAGSPPHEDPPMSASYEVRGDVAVITLNNPPVNGLGFDDAARDRRRPEQALADAGGAGHRASPAPARRSPAAPTSASSARRRRWPSRIC